MYDVGANVGSYTILASVLVGPTGAVMAFEPLAENVDYLMRHVQINRLENVEIIPAAVADSSGMTRFSPASDRVLGHIDPTGHLQVPCITLDDMVLGKGHRPPDCIKIDVEGGEVAVLRGAAQLLQSHRPIVFVATHGSSLDAECRAILLAAGYAVNQIDDHSDELLAVPAGTYAMRPGERVVPKER